MDARFAMVIVTLVAPLRSSSAAVTVTVPGATPVTSPALETVASPVSEEVQSTVLVIVFVLPSL
jgi:hypothetical protein